MNWLWSALGFNEVLDFQGARLRATVKDLNPPDETAIRVIIDTFKGKNDKIRPQVAFSTIVRKLSESGNRNEWVYLLKNLILMERCLEQKCFVGDIAELTCQSITKYKDQGQHSAYRPSLLLGKYFKYIQLKAELYKLKSSSYNVQRHSRKSFIQRMEPAVLFQQMDHSFKAISHCISFGECSSTGIVKFQLVQYVFQMLLLTILNLYITQQLCFYSLLRQSELLSAEQARKLKFVYTQFIINTERIVQFISCFKSVKSYKDVSLAQFYKPNKQIGRLIDSLIEEMESGSVKAADWVTVDYQFEQPLEVVRNSIFKRNVYRIPRRVKQDQAKFTVFTNYSNTFSDGFDPTVYNSVLAKDKSSQATIQSKRFKKESRQFRDTDSLESKDNVEDPSFAGSILFQEEKRSRPQFKNIYFSSTFVYHGQM